MDLERRLLARLDRRLLAGLDQDVSFRMVRVPATEAVWLTWKRYCHAVGISMGRGIAALIEHELVGALDEANHEGGEVLADRGEEYLAARERQVVDRENDLDAKEESLRRWTERLRHQESELRVRQQQVEMASRVILGTPQPGPKVGRNERCPCGSGLKYKYCHGLVGR